MTKYNGNERRKQPCEVCNEKEKEIKRILLSYKKDKILLYKIIGISNGVWLAIMLFMANGQLGKLLEVIIKIVESKL